MKVNLHFIFSSSPRAWRTVVRIFKLSPTLWTSQISSQVALIRKRKFIWRHILQANRTIWMLVFLASYKTVSFIQFIFGAAFLGGKLFVLLIFCLLQPSYKFFIIFYSFIIRIPNFLKVLSNSLELILEINFVIFQRFNTISRKCNMCKQNFNIVFGIRIYEFSLYEFDQRFHCWLNRSCKNFLRKWIRHNYGPFSGCFLFLH